VVLCMMADLDDPCAGCCAGGVELGPGVSLTAPSRQRTQPAVPKAPKPAGHQRNMDPVYQARIAHNASIRARAQVGASAALPQL
jgi:hypothetical protein